MSHPSHLWTAETYKATTHALVTYIYEHAKVQQDDRNRYVTDKTKHVPVTNYIANAARHAISHVSSEEHNAKVMPVLQIGGETFRDYLEYSKKITIPKSDPFHAEHAVVKKLATLFDKQKKEKQDDYKSLYKNMPEAFITHLCFGEAKTIWSEKVVKPIVAIFYNDKI